MDVICTAVATGIYLYLIKCIIETAARWTREMRH